MVNRTPRSEFSRLIGRERLAEAPFRECIRAQADERRALAGRLQVAALEELSAEFDVEPGPGNGLIEVRGRLAAKLTQLCVITLEPVTTTLNESFDVLYSLEGPASGPDTGSGEEDLDPDDEPAEVVGLRG